MRSPLIVIAAPGAPLPGARMPPEAIVVLPIVPIPASVLPLFTVVILDEAIEPSTRSTPAFTVVVPV